MFWEDDEPVFEVVDETRERDSGQSSVGFELWEDEELGFDEVEAIGLDGTGRDMDERFPYTWRKLTDAERMALVGYRGEMGLRNDR